MSKSVASERRSFHQLLFERPASVPRWAVGQVLHPDTVFSAAVVFLLLLPVLAGLVIFHAELDPRRNHAGADWLLLACGSLVGIVGTAAAIRLGLRMKLMARRIRETDLILRLLEDRGLLADDEQFASRLKQLDFAYLSQDTPFTRARILGYELAYFLGISRRPGIPSVLSSLALGGLPLLFTLLLLSPQEFGEGSALRAILLLLTTLGWQWGFLHLLSMTAGLGVLQQYVRELDRKDDDER